ncbi:MAG TPA: hypothetical protein PKD37_03920 [Oligoflexia bacterium]|nr:hypothetical protein [Oligoflexia bacterium]HMP27114.1 hypothetical protein [Oligoflexia bacterium]
MIAKVSIFIGILLGVICYLNLEVVAQVQYKRGLVGISAFGIQSENFQGVKCDRLIELATLSKRPAIAILYKTFGANNQCLYKFWNTVTRRKKQHLTEIHFSNEAGRRADRLDALDFMNRLNVSAYNRLLEKMSRKTERAIKSRVREIIQMIGKKYYKTGDFILSTGLEDNFTVKAWTNLYNVIKEVWPAGIVRNMSSAKMMRRQMRYRSWQPPSDIYIETHGYNRKLNQNNCIGNGDGQDVNFLENSGAVLHGPSAEDAVPATYQQVRSWIRRGRKNNCIMFIWAGKWQGLVKKIKKPSKPLKRQFYFDLSDIPRVAPLLTSR